MCLKVQVRFGEGPSEKCRKVTRWRPTLQPVRFGRGRLDSLARKRLAAYLITFSRESRASFRAGITAPSPVNSVRPRESKEVVELVNQAGALVDDGLQAAGNLTPGAEFQ